MSDLWKCGLGLIWMELLEEAGYHCLADLTAATDEALLAIPGMGPFKLRAIRRAVPRVAEPYEVEELADDLSSLPDVAASGGQHPDG